MGAGEGACEMENTHIVNLLGSMAISWKFAKLVEFGFRAEQEPSMAFFF